MRPYVTRVSSSIKEGVELEIGEKTLVIGPSGGGKTTLVQSIELALSGGASDVAGRTFMRDGAELFDNLAPPHANEIWAKVDFDTGATAEWKLERGRKPQLYLPQGFDLSFAFPLRAVREAVLGSVETARKFVLERIGFAWEDALSLVPESLRVKVADLVPPRPGPDGLVVALAAARERARRATTQVNAARKAANTASQGLGPEPTDVELEASRSKPSMTVSSEIVAQIAEKRREAEELGKQFQDLGLALERVGDAAAIHPAHQAAVTLLEATASHTTCYLCTHPVEPSEQARRLANAKKRLGAQAEAAKQRGRLDAERKKCSHELAVVQRELQRLEAEEKRMATLRAQSAPDAGLVARRERWKVVRRHEEEALLAESEANRYAQLADALAAAMKRALEGARTLFEGRVQSHLPPTDRFGLDLSSGERDVFQFGLRGAPRRSRQKASYPEEFLRKALSGAEWARVTAAIGMAVAGDSNGAEGACPPPLLIIPEERAHDDRTLGEVLEAFVKVDAQVILTHPQMPERRFIPPGWRVINMGEQPRRKIGTKAQPNEKEAHGE